MCGRGSRHSRRADGVRTGGHHGGGTAAAEAGGRGDLTAAAAEQDDGGSDGAGGRWRWLGRGGAGLPRNLRQPRGGGGVGEDDAVKPMRKHLVLKLVSLLYRP